MIVAHFPFLYFARKKKIPCRRDRTGSLILASLSYNISSSLLTTPVQYEDRIVILDLRARIRKQLSLLPPVHPLHPNLSLSLVDISQAKKGASRSTSARHPFVDHAYFCASRKLRHHIRTTFIIFPSYYSLRVAYPICIYREYTIMTEEHQGDHHHGHGHGSSQSLVLTNQLAANSSPYVSTSTSGQKNFFS